MGQQYHVNPHIPHENPHIPYPIHSHPHLLHQPPHLFQHHSAPQLDLVATLNQLSEGKKTLFDSIKEMNLRMNSSQNQPSSMIDQLTTGLKDINLEREKAPHLTRGPLVGGPTPVTRHQNISRTSSPSKGHYARDPDCKIVFREPKIRENICFSGDLKLLCQFSLDIYDVMDQHTTDFSSDKKRINWIASHFTSATSDSTLAQSWFTALFMKNAYVHGITDQYANVKVLSYVIAPLLSADAFINEMILVFADKMSAKTAQTALEKCKQGSTSIVDYNSRFGPLSFQV